MLLNACITQKRRSTADAPPPIREHTGSSLPHDPQTCDAIGGNGDRLQGKDGFFKGRIGLQARSSGLKGPRDGLPRSSSRLFRNAHHHGLTTAAWAAMPVPQNVWLQTSVVMPAALALARRRTIAQALVRWSRSPLSCTSPRRPADLLVMQSTELSLSSIPRLRKHSASAC